MPQLEILLAITKISVAAISLVTQTAAMPSCKQNSYHAPYLAISSNHKQNCLYG